MALGLVLLPWVAMGISYLVTPGYLGPFIKHPLGFGCLLIGLIMSGIAYAILQATRVWVVWTVTILFLILPQFVVPMLGPALMTIMQALGPVYSEKSNESTTTTAEPGAADGASDGASDGADRADESDAKSKDDAAKDDASKDDYSK